MLRLDQKQELPMVLACRVARDVDVLEDAHATRHELLVEHLSVRDIDRSRDDRTGEHHMIPLAEVERDHIIDDLGEHGLLLALMAGAHDEVFVLLRLDLLELLPHLVLVAEHGHVVGEVHDAYLVGGIHIFADGPAREDDLPVHLLPEIHDGLQAGDMRGEGRHDDRLALVVCGQQDIPEHLLRNILRRHLLGLTRIEGIHDEADDTFLAELLKTLVVGRLPQHGIVVELEIVGVHHAAVGCMQDRDHGLRGRVRDVDELDRNLVAEHMLAIGRERTDLVRDLLVLVPQHGPKDRGGEGCADDLGARQLLRQERDGTHVVEVRMRRDESDDRGFPIADEREVRDGADLEQLLVADLEHIIALGVGDVPIHQQAIVEKHDLIVHADSGAVLADLAVTADGADF